MVVGDEDDVDLRERWPIEPGRDVSPNEGAESLRHHGIDEGALPTQLNQESGVPDPGQGVFRSPPERFAIVRDDRNLDPGSWSARPLFIVKTELPLENARQARGVRTSVEIEEPSCHRVL
jgi:hypothetical protein